MKFVRGARIVTFCAAHGRHRPGAGQIRMTDPIIEQTWSLQLDALILALLSRTQPSPCPHWAENCFAIAEWTAQYRAGPDSSRVKSRQCGMATIALAAPTPDRTKEFPLTARARLQHLERLSQLRWRSLGIVVFVVFVSFVGPVSWSGDARTVSIPAPSREASADAARRLKITVVAEAAPKQIPEETLRLMCNRASNIDSAADALAKTLARSRPRGN